MKKIELLSPAGSYDIFLLALRAGADAVYFAGPEFGARAFAKNFSEEEVVKAINVAHLFEKKAYLTVNTLLKEKELQKLYEYILPFYQVGLDGLIVQDMGVLHYIRENFPGLEIHASTQMAIMGENGINFLEKQGVERVVLARELSLDEIKDIKANTNLELEIFVHGAMCYSYSGQCLLSSVIGGRSGNRGRCAQPCRLPYHKGDQNPCYPISMKDQCAITHLEELIYIGVDSLKIEGRMKKPEYVAKVTAIYRKYIDMIYEKMESGSNKAINFSKKDLNVLENLYVRNALHDGYFEKNNSKDMITLNTSAYKETKDELLSKIQSDMDLIDELKIKLRCNIYVYVNQEIQLKIEMGEKYYNFEGKLAELAKNQPINEENIKKQLKKTQDTFFEFTSILVHTDGKCFVAMGELNALRRRALEEIQNDLLRIYSRKDVSKKDDVLKVSDKKELKETNKSLKQDFSVLISTVEQLKIVLKYRFSRIYIPIDFYIMHKDLLQSYVDEKSDLDLHVALPYVLREKDLHLTKKWNEILNSKRIAGVLVRNMEEVGLLQKMNYQKCIQLDYFMYCMNTSAVKFWSKFDYKWTYPLELNRKELKHVPIANEMLIYGRIPVMLSANCINKTLSECNCKSATVFLTDRMNKKFPIKMDCKYCYNVMYNSLPLSLHNYLHEINTEVTFRIEFTFEAEKECDQICSAYLNNNGENNSYERIKEYTNGHYKRGVD